MSKLEQLGYYFDDKDVLRTISDNEKFKFTTQQQYEELGQAVELEVYKLMKERCGLVQIPLKPSGCPLPNDEVGFIFATPDFFQKETVLILMHGSGVVRAGQWARRLIINENLETGTQLAYINRAIFNGWGVLVFNSNHNTYQNKDGGLSYLKYSENPVEHCIHAWQFLVYPCIAKKIHIVAHSRGGYDVSRMLERFHDDLRVTLVCLTDAPVFDYPEGNDSRENPLIAVNFLARGEITDKEYYIRPFKVNRVLELYAGTKVHESSSHTALYAIFHILEKNMTPKSYIQVMAECRQMVGPEMRARKKRDEEYRRMEKQKELAAAAAATAVTIAVPTAIPAATSDSDDGPPDAKRQRIVQS